jgi:hypothetical protein
MEMKKELMIEEALVQAMEQLYSRVELFPYEARAIVETAVDDIGVMKPKDEAWNMQLNSYKDTTLEVNLLDLDVFTQQLLDFGEESGIFEVDAVVRVSPLSASLAAQRVIRIVQETWNHSRDIIIQHSVFLNKHSKQEGKRPSEYCQSDVRAVIASIGLLFDNFAHCNSGQELLCVPRNEVRRAFGLSSSLLLLRFLTVQRVLQLLELWSEKGASFGLPGMPFSRDVQAWGLVLPSLEQPVEIAVFPKLLAAYTNVSRTTDCDWNVPLLTSLCSRVASSQGALVPYEAIDLSAIAAVAAAAAATAAHVPEGEESEPVLLGLGSGATTDDNDDNNSPALCAWVELRAEDLHLDVPVMEALYQSGLLLLEEGRRAGKVLVKVPLAGLRCLRGDFGANAAYMLTAATVLDLGSNTTLSGEGIVCRVDSYTSLCAACQRFEWWDRPQERTLLQMAGGLVQVIATQDVFSHHRIGARLLSSPSCNSSNSSSSGDLFEVVIDALPIECLTLYYPDSPREHQQHQSSGNNSSKSSSKKSNKAGKAGRAQPGKAKSGKKTEAQAVVKQQPKQKQERAVIQKKKEEEEDFDSNNSTIATGSGVFTAIDDSLPDLTAPVPASGKGRAASGKKKDKQKLDLHSGKSGVDKTKSRSNNNNAGRPPLPPPAKPAATRPAPTTITTIHKPASTPAALEQQQQQCEEKEEEEKKEGGGPVVVERPRPGLHLTTSKPEQDQDQDQDQDQEPVTSATGVAAIGRLHGVRLGGTTRPHVIIRRSGGGGGGAMSPRQDRALSEAEGNNKSKQKKPKPEKVSLPPFSWLRARAVQVEGKNFDLQTALQRLDRNIATDDGPAWAHPAYAAMLRLDKDPSVKHYKGRSEDEEEAMKSFAVYKLLGKSVHASVEADIADRHQKGVRYTEYAQAVLEEDEERREQVRQQEEEQYVRAGVAMAVTQVQFEQYDPACEVEQQRARAAENKSGSMCNDDEAEPYLQAVRAKQVAAQAGLLKALGLPRGGFMGTGVRTMAPIAVVTKVERRVGSRGDMIPDVHVPGAQLVTEGTSKPHPLPEEEDGEVREERGHTFKRDGGASSKTAIAVAADDHSTVPELGSPVANIMPPPVYIPQTLAPRQHQAGNLLEVVRKPIVDKSTGAEVEMTDAAADCSGGKPVPYWKADAIRSARPGSGIGTKAYSEQVTAHAQVPGGAVTRQTTTSSSGVADGGVKPTASILAESIAVEEARRRQQQQQGHGQRIMPVGALFSHIGQNPNTDVGATPRDPEAPGTTSAQGETGEFVDFVQGSRLGIIQPRNKHVRSDPKIAVSVNKNSRRPTTEEEEDDQEQARSYVYTLSSAMGGNGATAVRAPEPGSLPPPQTHRSALMTDRTPTGAMTTTAAEEEEEEFLRPFSSQGHGRSEDPRVSHMEGLAFLQASLDEANAAADYAGENGGTGEERLERLLFLKGQRERQQHPWTQDSAAPDPNKVDEDERKAKERRERELRVQRSKVKFRLRPESPPPLKRPLSGLPSSPGELRREQLRAESAVGDVIDSDRLQGMQDALAAELLFPAYSAGQDDGGATLEGSPPRDTLLSPDSRDNASQAADRQVREEEKTAGGEAAEAGGGSTVTTRVTLPKLALSATVPSLTKTGDTSLVNLLDAAAANNDDDDDDVPAPQAWSRPASPSSVVTNPRPYPHGPYRLDPINNGIAVEEEEEAVAADTDQTPNRASLLAKVGPADMVVSVKTYTAPPLYLHRERQALEGEKRIVQDSGFDLGALIDDLLARRERSIKRREDEAQSAGATLTTAAAPLADEVDEQEA